MVIRGYLYEGCSIQVESAVIVREENNLVGSYREESTTFFIVNMIEETQISISI